MLTGLRLAFVGGDARQTEVIRYVIEQDATAILVGFDQWDAHFPDTEHRVLEPEALSGIDALVLPVAGLANDGTANAKYSSEPLRLTSEHFESLPRHCKVFTGIAGEYLTRMCEQNDLELIRLMELDEVAILNSIPTAEGAIQMAMENTSITIHGSRSAVVGFGRCGVTLARLLRAMGSEVMVAARKPADLARIREMSLIPCPFPELTQHLAHADLIFNTVPSMVLSTEVLAHVNSEAVIIDIATAPGGTDFRYAQKRGIKAILAPSLPGIVAPKTAGRIIGTILARCLRED